jgi:NAD(P)-dependent dehydrogenase (short-subunit alcohol dehydrogenase family)
MSVLVTGSSSGFGEVIVRTLACAGYHVLATMRDAASKNRDTAQQLVAWAHTTNRSLEIVEMDVTDDDSVNGAVARILDSGCDIDVVVNNAGIAAAGPIEAFDTSQMWQVLNTNAIGPIRVDRAVLPHMRARRSGLLIHVSSTLGRILPGSGGLYPASKWALEGLAESLRYQVAPFGVDIVILEPGSFPTPAVGRAMLPADDSIAREYAAMGAGMRRPAEPGPGYVLPDVQEIGDAVRSIIETPTGERQLRYVVGPIFTEGVNQFNQEYEATKLRLIEALKRPDQAITWGMRDKER